MADTNPHSQAEELSSPAPPTEPGPVVEAAAAAAPAAAAAAPTKRQMERGVNPETGTFWTLGELKRKKKKEKREELKQERKAETKRINEERRAAGLVKIPAQGGSIRERAPEDRTEAQAKKIRLADEFVSKAKEGGYTLVIDMDFEPFMSERELNSMVQQIKCVYASNKRSAQPAEVVLTGLGPKIKEGISRISGLDFWKAFRMTDKSYMEEFPPESLVYLTADSPNVITTFEPGKYIFGGIVDRNRHKKITLDRANRQGIATARLPLDALKMNSGYSKILTLNHAVELCLAAIERGGSMDASCVEKVLPARKVRSTPS